MLPVSATAADDDDDDDDAGAEIGASGGERRCSWACSCCTSPAVSSGDTGEVDLDLARVETGEPGRLMRINAIAPDKPLREAAAGSAAYRTVALAAPVAGAALAGRTRGDASPLPPPLP